MTSAERDAGLRIVFAGTPDFAAHHLQALLDSHHRVVGVYTQPDRPAGRGKKLRPSPVKVLAESHDLPVYQPERLKGDAARAELAALEADLMVVVAYGLLLPQSILDTPRLGCINVHASLLPRWRGAAPIQRAIEAGDQVSGVTIMQMDAGLDTGAMLVKAECTIDPEDTGGSLHDKLLEVGGPALLDALAQLAEGRARPESQDDSEANYAAKFSKNEAALDWHQSAERLALKVRAFNPFPVATTRESGSADRIRLWQAHALPQTADAAPGTVVATGAEGIDVACGEGCLRLTRIQLPGKKALPVADLLRGHPQLLSPGTVLELPA
ncbi:methionyl-tRNA formyltransferase [Marinimicrobium alkaliphilum]|uniref:methionyl-tRNA formyltransferase n=1 Tax=Marinimicrobium alkaliphilum TaxID=2202654 RepID=UPI000DBA6092|nr:methionyl-tRNA formyltransferase [Marinimicrobium alkaliphilum]